MTVEAIVTFCILNMSLVSKRRPCLSGCTKHIHFTKKHEQLVILTQKSRVQGVDLVINLQNKKNADQTQGKEVIDEKKNVNLVSSREVEIRKASEKEVTLDLIGITVAEVELMKGEIQDVLKTIGMELLDTVASMQVQIKNKNINHLEAILAQVTGIMMIITALGGMKEQEWTIVVVIGTEIEIVCNNRLLEIGLNRKTETGEEKEKNSDL